MRVVVVGAGAAGTMAAIWAASTGAETLLLERKADGGRKILISGGGRCNILPVRVDESRFVTASPRHLLRKIVRAGPLLELVAFFERAAGMPLVVEAESGKYFPASQSARDARDRLYGLARRRGVTPRTDARVVDVRPEGGGWRVELEHQAPLQAEAVILATGGLSVPKTGRDGDGLRIAERLGHILHQTYPALTPLVADPPPFGDLAGISLPVTITARAGALAARASGGVLFTHRGYSGPAVLDVSHVAVLSRGSAAPARVEVRWTGSDEDAWDAALRPQGARSVAAALGRELPDRLARALVEHAGIDRTRTLSNLTRDERRRLVERLTRFELPWTGDEGYRTAEVTGGGVSLEEVHPATLESRRHPRLFLCGEMLDGFGAIGGYNFLWAWATGRAAGLGAARCTAS